jgi:diguanylate cyclase (GGDEF)-like protein/PAS domain S-box-containing protein
MTEDGNFYKEIIDNLYDGVYFVDRERVITYWNKGAERITGYTGRQVVGRSCRDNLLNHVTADGVQLCLSACPLVACMVDGKMREADVFLHHADGHRLPVLIRATPLRDAQGDIIGAVETFSSDAGVMTVRNELRELRRTAQTDKLTGISNRRYLEGQLRAVIAELEYQADTVAGLLFIDIDHFKQFNDTYDHDVGDKVLHMVAATLHHNLRANDVLGRWGGEEFLVIIHDVTSLKELRSISEKLRALVESSRLDLADKNLTVTISVGATLLLSSDTPVSLVRRADELMYQSKRAGRNRVSVG